jgi:hypothetical protein
MQSGRVTQSEFEQYPKQRNPDFSQNKMSQAKMSQTIEKCLKLKNVSN